MVFLLYPVLFASSSVVPLLFVDIVAVDFVVIVVVGFSVFILVLLLFSRY